MAAALTRAAVTAEGTQCSTLVAHPDTLSPTVAGITINTRWIAPSMLASQYILRADMTRVRIPAGQGRGRRDGLWRHTCFEVFVKAPDFSGYYEFNFSPAGEWAAYHFEDYRQGMTPAPLHEAPKLQARVTPGELELSAMLDLSGLPELTGASPLRLALAAVVEDPTGALSYWSLRHPPGRPDFHHAEGFVLELRAP